MAGRIELVPHPYETVPAGSIEDLELMALTKIISGRQTGVDRGALDAALVFVTMSVGLQGGWFVMDSIVAAGFPA